MKREYIGTGKTVDEAIEAACAALGCERSEIEFEILALAKKSFFGLRTTPAQVKVTWEDGTPEPRANRPQEGRREKKAEKPEGCAVIGIDDFMKVELRTAQVISCEPVPKAKKLLKLQIDLGYEKRQVVSGIAKFYKPEDLVGKKLIVVANLAPAKLCGVESQGMILASGEEQVRVVFLDPETPLGERVR